ncbi:MAG: hypothetical protein WAW17_26955 [Rhodococcus sp. (in: high G+C Gram-positive bacteria)]|uniref:hypothetical protein n=1 Tax=Rhodococcus sp. TaxID=1831 RepID=UPI003BB07632
MPDQLTAIAAAAYTAGARPDLHNLGGVHADAHHAALSLERYDPEQLPRATWSAILTRHLVAAMR